MLRGKKLAGGLALLGLGSCSIAFNLDRQQCEVAADCDARGFPASECVQNICQPIEETGGSGGEGGAPVVLPAYFECVRHGFTPPVPQDGMITHKFQFELATQAGVVPANLTTKLCSALDVNCLNPDPSAPQPDANGLLTLTLAANFAGFVEIQSDETMPSLAFFQPPVVLPPTTKLVRLIRQTEFEGLVSAAGRTWDPTRGSGVVITDDCNDERQAGVYMTSMDLDDQADIGYFTGALPNLMAEKTDSQGAGALLNMPVGAVTISTFVFGSGVYIGTNTLRSRAGYISYLPVGPSL
ncbi:MAG: hypothetical protein U0271_06070 [Polyangiaceae bacterium]